jgi:hypothetical protein
MLLIFFSQFFSGATLDVQSIGVPPNIWVYDSRHVFLPNGLKVGDIDVTSNSLDPSIHTPKFLLPDSSHPDPLSGQGGALLFGTTDKGWIEAADVMPGPSQPGSKPADDIIYDNAEEDDNDSEVVMTDPPQNGTPEESATVMGSISCEPVPGEIEIDSDGVFSDSD